MSLVKSQFSPVSVNGAGDIDFIAVFTSPTCPGKKVESGALSVKEGMVNEKPGMFQFKVLLQKKLVKVLIGGQ